MPYRVTFTGGAEEEVLPDGVGSKVYDEWQKGSLPEKVELRPGRTIKSAKIAEIRFIRGDAGEDYQYSRNELQDFERDKLKPYLAREGRLPLIGRLNFLNSEKLLRFEIINTPVVIERDVHMFINPDLVKEYAKMVEKLSQWQNMHDKRDYGLRMRDKELEEVALASVQDSR